MGALESNTTLVYGIHLRESANDGSDFSNAAAGYRVLFLGEDGNLYVKDSSGTVTQVGGGSSGGGLVLLEQHTASSSASLDFTSFISSTYDTYKIEVVELAPATDTASCVMSIGTGGGPTYDSGNNYEWAAVGETTAAAGWAFAGTTGVAGLFPSMSNNAGYGIGHASLTVTGLQSTTHRKTFHGTIQYVTSIGPASRFGVWGAQWVTTGTAVTALRFSMTSGNIASGTIRIYGVEK